MTDRSATISVRRTDGSRSRFTVDVDEYTTLIDALESMRVDDDPDLLYRHSCHHGSCGTCGMIVNGERKLACVMRLADLPPEIVVEPLTPFPVIGDLAVDPARLYDDFPDEATYLRPSEANHESEVPPEIQGFTRFENCIECGLCVSVCPVQERFIGPAALAAYAREISKRPERASELLPKIDSERGVWGCDRALRCSEVCPLGVYPARHIADLRRMLND